MNWGSTSHSHFWRPSCTGIASPRSSFFLFFFFSYIHLYLLVLNQSIIDSFIATRRHVTRPLINLIRLVKYGTTIPPSVSGHYHRIFSVSLSGLFWREKKKKKEKKLKRLTWLGHTTSTSRYRPIPFSPCPRIWSPLSAAANELEIVELALEKINSPIYVGSAAFTYSSSSLFAPRNYGTVVNCR